MSEEPLYRVWNVREAVGRKDNLRGGEGVCRVDGQMVRRHVQVALF